MQTNSDIKTSRLDVLICCGSGCISAGALKIKEKMEGELTRHNLSSEVNLIETGCMGPCDFGPVMMVYPDDVFYRKVSVDDVEELVEEHFLKGRPLKRLMVQDENEKVLTAKAEIPFYKEQQKVALDKCGYLDPDSIEEYIALGGYEALGKVITEMKPEAAIEMVKKSGLRGRGGGGFSTGTK